MGIFRSGRRVAATTVRRPIEIGGEVGRVADNQYNVWVAPLAGTVALLSALASATGAMPSDPEVPVLSAFQFEGVVNNWFAHEACDTIPEDGFRGWGEHALRKVIRIGWQQHECPVDERHPEAWLDDDINFFPENDQQESSMPDWENSVLVVDAESGEAHWEAQALATVHELGATAMAPMGLGDAA